MCPDTSGTVVTQQSTDSGGAYGLSGFTVPARVTAGLDGELATVLNCDGLEIGACLSAMNAGTLVHLAGCTDLNAELTSVNFVLNPTPSEFDVAQVTVHEYIRKTHDWFAELQPTFYAIDRNLPCFTNVLPTDDLPNAGYNRTLELLAFAAGNFGFKNWAMPSVIAHEYGHFILDQALEVRGAIHEGVADVVSTFLNHTPYLGYDQRIN